jgi:hypothetical protein
VFKPNEFYERLIILRDTNREAFARFGSETRAALEAYEAAKRSAEAASEKGRQRSDG